MNVSNPHGTMSVSQMSTQQTRRLKMYVVETEAENILLKEDDNFRIGKPMGELKMIKGISFINLGDR